ncbi:helix-turn-helix domain-containing protein [Aestuariivirga sp. YIM B02566]|uniref:Uncharacterized protein n=1 Tax=Taklimakanibacter albus TaxID=2800327 RepID=A0ACC5RG19_9HYPH|nr:helix-turn-helix domain-containing protein [Aestuariivirga sp. YIM B02566]MBK1871549.1 hypothetical protein [Aestuariivirga sp. YIM B02566]
MTNIKHLKALDKALRDKATNIPDNIRGQKRMILEYLMTGRTLTPVVALTTMGIGSLTKRIQELRGLGQHITGTWKTDHFGRSYMSYRLGGDGGSEANKAVKEKYSKKEKA